MKDNFGRLDYLKITIYGFALAALWSSLHSIVLPLRLLDMVAEAEKNTYLGLLTFAGLLLAMIVQPIAGAISDRSGFKWGRRRPYILIGSLLGVLLLPGIGLFQSYFAGSRTPGGHAGNDNNGERTSRQEKRRTTVRMENPFPELQG